MQMPRTWCVSACVHIYLKDGIILNVCMHCSAVFVSMLTFVQLLWHMWSVLAWLQQDSKSAEENKSNTLPKNSHRVL